MKNKKNDKKKLLKAISLVNQIQKIRSQNNNNWMDLLKLSLKLDFKNSSKILKEIVKEDRRNSKIADKISKLK
jgi:hypothetical protein|tara:strand:+ start:225 stop:443 length:219 start_codon:yes stop_codon:yes gene_type:complete